MHRHVLASLPCLLALILVSGADAADIVTLEDECNGRQLLLQGPIEPGDSERLERRLEALAAGPLPAVQNPDVLWTVKLDSPGGDLAEAMALGRLLRRVLATTEVGYRFAARPDGVYDLARGGELVCLDGDGRLGGCRSELVAASCTGACLLVWLGGAERHALDGRLGVHGLAGGETTGVLEYLAAMGVSDAWRARILGRPASGDGWLPWPDRRALSGRAEVLRTLLADCPPPLDRDDAFAAVTHPDAAVRERLAARADASRRCRNERLAAARAARRQRS